MADHLTEQRAETLVKNRKRRVWKRIVSALGCLVVFCTVYALVLPAITASEKTFCGEEEHKHTDACYERVLTCGLEERERSVIPGHTHGDSCYQEEQVLVCALEESEDLLDENGEVLEPGHLHGSECYQVNKLMVCGLQESDDQVIEGHAHGDACYERQLVCTKKEHTHKEECFIDKTADVETRTDWEATLPDASELDGVWADDLLAVADSQLGYAESQKNYVIDEEKGYNRGWTRYGSWYGDPYGDWCAMFISFCLHYAGVPAEAMPRDANCQNWIKTLSGEEFDMYYPASGSEQESGDSFEPVPGDLIFFDWGEGDGVSDHVGIVYEFIEQTDSEPAKVKTIEGNSSDRVEYVTYELNDSSIMGYASLPIKNDEESTTLEEEQPAAQAEESEPEGVPGIQDGAKVYQAGGKPFYQTSYHGLGSGNGIVETFALIPVKEGYSADELANYDYTPTEWTASADANYAVAYCADKDTRNYYNGAEYSVYTLDNSRIANEESRQKLATIVMHAYPFITATEMKANMAAAGVAGVEDCSESELIAATQQAIWMITSPTSDIQGSGYSSQANNTKASCVNPLEESAVLHKDGSHVPIISKYLSELKYLPELEVSSWTPSYEEVGNDLYNLEVEVELNRGVSAEENVTVQLVAGGKSSAQTKLVDGTKSFTLNIEGVTAKELSDSSASILVDGQRVQAYFYDSETYQDMIGGNWEKYEYDLSFAVGESEETSVFVSKVWADGNPGAKSVEVNLLANGVKQGAPVSLSAENDWRHTWSGLPKTDLLNNAINYTVSEKPIDGYLSIVGASDAPSTGKVWQRISDTEDFVDGGEYVLMFPSGALAWAEENTDGRNMLAWQRVNLGNTSNASANAIWVAEKDSSGRVCLSNKGKSSTMDSYLSLNGSTMKFSYWGSRASVSYSKGALKISSYGPGGELTSEGYLSALRQAGTGLVVPDESPESNKKPASALKLTVYRLVEVDLPKSDVNYVITNHKVDNTADPVDVSVEKKWEGDRNGDYPDSAKVYLLQNGKRYGDAVTLSKANNWAHTWEGLPSKYEGTDAEVVYTVEEAAVDGYKASVTTKGGDAYSYVLTNTKQVIMGDIIVKKIRSDDDEITLQGAEFDLYIVDASGSAKPELGIDGDKVVKFNTAPIVTGADGTITVKGVEVGETYYLVETKSPAGYEMLTCPIRFTVGGTSGAPVITVAEGSPGQAWAQVDEKSADVLLVKNAGGYELPSTGGSGTKAFAMLGATLVVASMTALFFRRKRRRRSVSC